MASSIVCSPSTARRSLAVQLRAAAASAAVCAAALTLVVVVVVAARTQVTHSYTFDDVRKSVSRSAPRWRAGCSAALARRKLLNEADWDIVEMSKDHIFPYSIAEYVRHEYVREPCWAKLSDDEFRQFERELGWHLLIRARRK